MNKTPWKSPSPYGSKYRTTPVTPPEVIPTPMPVNKQIQPPAPVFDGKLECFYQTERNRTVTTIYLVDVRKDTVLFKDSPSDKHTQSMPLAKFVKFYKAV